MFKWFKQILINWCNSGEVCLHTFTTVIQKDTHTTESKEYNASWTSTTKMCENCLVTQTITILHVKEEGEVKEYIYKDNGKERKR